MHNAIVVCSDCFFLDVNAFAQAVFRPVDDRCMEAAVDAIVAFIEGPDVEGTRDWPIDTIWAVLDNPRTVLPDIGIAPRALLLAALKTRRTACNAMGKRATLFAIEKLSMVNVHLSMTNQRCLSSFCTHLGDTFEEWLLVSLLS